MHGVCGVCGLCVYACVDAGGCGCCVCPRRNPFPPPRLFFATFSCTKSSVFHSTPSHQCPHPLSATKALSALHHRLLPFVLRRLKSDHLADLPAKVIQDVLCDLTPAQVVGWPSVGALRWVACYLSPCLPCHPRGCPFSYCPRRAHTLDLVFHCLYPTPPPCYRRSCTLGCRPQCSGTRSWRPLPPPWLTPTALVAQWNPTWLSPTHNPAPTGGARSVGVRQRLA
jgi:hypothetical protein